jgi:hypothetical protein
VHRKRRSPVEWMVETLHQEVLNTRHPLDRPETARGLNPHKERRKSRNALAHQDFSHRDSENRGSRGQEVTYTSTSKTPKSRKVIGLWSYKGRSYGPKSLVQGTSRSWSLLGYQRSGNREGKGMRHRGL